MNILSMPDSLPSLTLTYRLDGITAIARTWPSDRPCHLCDYCSVVDRTCLVLTTRYVSKDDAPTFGLRDATTP